MAVKFSLNRRAEDAFTKVIKQMVGTALSGFEYFKGFEAKAQTAPRIHVLVRRCAPNVVGGCVIAERTLTVETTIATQYVETTRDTHAKAAAALEAVYYHNGGTENNPTIVQRVNNVAASNFQATIWTPSSQEEGLNDSRGEFLTIFTGELECLEKLV